MERRRIELDFVTTEIGANWGFKPLVVDYCASCGYVDPEYERILDEVRQAEEPEVVS